MGFRGIRHVFGYAAREVFQQLLRTVRVPVDIFVCFVYRHRTPRIKDVVGSNYAHIGAATEGTTVAVFVAIDNLMKGAAGGCVQWMNRLLGLDETAGLTTPGPD